MRRAAVIAISAAVVVGVAAGATALALAGRDAEPEPTADARYTITEPYAYPEVDFAADPAENVETLRIPQETLDAMTTEALAWSVIDFPYFGNFMMSSQLNGGVEFLRQQSDALDTLLERDDAEDAVRWVRSAFVASDTQDEFAELKIMLLDEILVELGRS